MIRFHLFLYFYNFSLNKINFSILIHLILIKKIEKRKELTTVIIEKRIGLLHKDF